MVACLVFAWQFVAKSTGMGKDNQLSFSDVLSKADEGNVADVTVNGPELTGHMKGSKDQFHTTIPANYPDMYKTLRDHGVNINVKDPNANAWVGVLFQFAPILLLLALFFFMMRQMQSGGNKALSFGKSRARLLSMQQKKITFKDVAGVDEAKEELKEIIEFLREAQKFQRLGGRIPKGVLFDRASGNRQELFSPARLPAKPTFPSSRFPVQTLSRCSSASAQAVFATFSSRERRMHPASSSSMKSTRSVVIAVQALVADTTNVSRPSTSSSSRWTASSRMTVSS